MLRPVTLRPLRAAQQPAFRAARRTISSSRGSSKLTQEFDLNRLNAQRRDYDRNRTAFLTAGAVAGIISFIYTAWKLKKAIEANNAKEGGGGVKFDSPPNIPTEQFKTEAGELRKIIVHDEDGNEVVPTGNSTVPLFPRTINVSLPLDTKRQSTLEASITDSAGTQYTLVGLGMRSVTFIGINVYLVGLYVATQDIARLQHYLVKSVNPVATTLIPSEKDALRRRLLDPVEGEALWDALLRDAGLRSVLRIAPVRDTDFHHLRDGFVRAVQARSALDKAAYGDEAFGAAMKAFKALFNRGQVPKKKEMLLCRGEGGALAVTYDAGGKQQREVLGTIEDPRLSHLLWLNYLAGSKVASEPARKNIVEGVMEFVERPVGTVATQVV
ncbi:Chalcone isomerase, subgroup [Cordyceps fumosorosea ARSEF 2679]|uniref:Chalcone isomerase, subgroup n=1 Tax=Cordyceps fumosorosea (strain ARSEF 2679) TaxID=1081104 RepID=A0A167I9C5_CORFA|nr:Chalcone isomerase, subgroup [Cordyceps fumosorosea ARSEF 2679]OAA48819.1 Chalcone isomerase, subgroup [Cordyceps fumosorosea ARSEF 2679]